MRKLLVFVLVMLIAPLVVACHDTERGGDVLKVGTAFIPGDTLRVAQQSLNEEPGYRLKVEAHNLVLPQWGGMDGADLQIGTQGPVVTGTIDRTGDGRYEVRFVDGQTYFRRETCDHWASIPGGGRDVLRPFLWSETYDLQDARDVQYTSPAVIQADIGDLGLATIEFEGSSVRPLRLEQQEGAQSIWTFSDWGKAPSVEKPSGDIGDQGPGGNPC